MTCASDGRDARAGPVPVMAGMTARRSPTKVSSSSIPTKRLWVCRRIKQRNASEASSYYPILVPRGKQLLSDTCAARQAVTIRYLCREASSYSLAGG